ncbi:hypothetical protein BH18ACT12_BH18ACT12_20550 [soil metagenome]
MTLCGAVAATALVAAAAAQSAPTHRLQSPQRSEISRAGRAISDSMLPARLSVPRASWGGAYRTATGESVTVFASNAYPVDPTVGQRWADFLASLVHGFEISSVIVFLAPASTVEQLCGQDAVACYSAPDDLLVAPGEDPDADLSSEAVIAHEYGHHLAANRSNAPWDALDTGTKRWASSIQVCAKARKGDLVPGAEDPVQYEINPGEGFAEAYRVLNERKAGRIETPWRIVSDLLYPNAAALHTLELDVTAPWERDTTTTQAGRFTRSTRTRTFTVATPLDGRLRVTLRPSSGTRLSLDVFAASKRVAHAAGAATLARGTTICGTRSYRMRVRALKGNGSFSLAVSKP